MEDKIIILIVLLVAVAGVGGYVLGLYQGSGNFTLNVTNNTTGNSSNTAIPKTTTNVTPVKNNTNKTNNTPGNNSTI
jgi:hypothetical protein